MTNTTITTTMTAADAEKAFDSLRRYFETLSKDREAGRAQQAIARNIFWALDKPEMLELVYSILIPYNGGLRSGPTVTFTTTRVM